MKGPRSTLQELRRHPNPFIRAHADHALEHAGWRRLRSRLLPGQRRSTHTARLHVRGIRVQLHLKDQEAAP